MAAWFAHPGTGLPLPRLDATVRYPWAGGGTYEPPRAARDADNKQRRSVRLCRYDAAVDAYALNPTVEGALIGSGAALIAVILTTLGTFATLRANRVATRDERLWERRTALYEELIEIALGDPGPSSVKELLIAQDSKIFAYASDSVLTWYTRVHDVNERDAPSDPEVSDIVRTSVAQQDPNEYIDRAMVMRLVTVIRDELQGRRSRSFAMWARTFLWRNFDVRELPRRRAGR